MEEIGANIPPIKVYADKFQDQIVVVTGGAAGIGEETAKLFAAQGAVVILVDINKDNLQKVSSEIESQGGKALTRVCNVGVEAQVDSVINEVASTLGKIDVLVHLAGIYPFHTLQDHPAALYHHIMNVNMDSCFFLTRAVLPHMQKAGYGRIINTATGTCLFPFAGISAYVASKAAVIGFTRVTAAEAGPGVTANVLVPGLIRTETGLKGGQTQPLYDLMRHKQCIKRNGLPQDIAHTASFIASPEAQFITGQSFDIGGGITFS
ncbi:hypothetical protein MMC08_006429 [Hypocenomyce scalaris]|nr:hypothetical protein [Hypocenomyce scalaris]